MSPTTKRAFGSPVVVDGTFARVVAGPAGILVETWEPIGWQLSRLTLADVLYAPVASETALTALAVPREDWGREETLDEIAARSAKMVIENLRNRLDRKMREAQAMIVRNLRDAKNPDA